MAGTRKDAEDFVREWTGRGDENQDTQLFWIGLMQNVLGLDDALSRLKFEVPSQTDASSHVGFADVLIPSARTIVEQKSVGIDLSKTEKRQGRKVTPAQQARDYAEGMPLSQQPRYVIACNFAELWCYDRERDALCRNPMWKLSLAKLPKNLATLQFLAGTEKDAPETVSQAVSKEAGRIMGRLHALAATGFDDPDTPENHHALSVLMTRLMFLMFCEDSGLIAPNAFRDFVKHYDAEDLSDGLADLFRWLDTPDAERTGHHADRWTKLPYMDGGLFREDTEVPQLTEDFKYTLVVDGCQEFDWSGVSPTVFGSIFEGALSHDHRRENGQHFTSPENIHKVIDPLFLTSLRAEYTRACGLPVAGGARTKALRALHRKIGTIAVLDPAAGSGNFLTESYISLRRLENQVMFELARNGQAAFSFEGTDAEAEEDHKVLVSLRNFHGIELEDYACCVARTALWIAEKQMDAETQMVTQRVYQALPLTDYAGIVRANALRIDWESVVPASKLTCVCGNPPFIGQYTKTEGQAEDVHRVWEDDYDGYLDYVTCWYRKAADYLAHADADFAFVSTNSICQGRPVPSLMGPLFRDGWQISFAHRTFIWDSQADDEAHVHVIIVGMSKHPGTKLLWSYDRKGQPLGERVASNINGYLLEAPNVLIKQRSKPLSKSISPVVYGSKPADGGFLQIKDEAVLHEAMADPIAAKYVRPCVGATEFINRKKRWCLWLVDAPAVDIASSPFLKDRVQQCYEWRSSRKKTGDAYKLRDIPAQFRPNKRMPKGSYLCIPCHFSGVRRYFTATRCEHGEIATNACFMADDPDGLLFAVISSSAFMAWQRAVGGEIKSDGRFSNTVVYNNFPLPDLDEAARSRVIAAGRAVIDARSLYEGLSLADLYRSGDEFLYPELYAAHASLDKAVNEALGIPEDASEEEVQTRLFELYARISGGH